MRLAGISALVLAVAGLALAQDATAPPPTDAPPAAAPPAAAAPGAKAAPAAEDAKAGADAAGATPEECEESWEYIAFLRAEVK